ncbi:Methyl-accepting chemotaxis protein McpA [Sporomusa silvacetica DSM 10669]|uniref:Methyl-accepting chemotaxis protein McpA n=1 Tax=Sporomusa silvacetica DSM 10669 TaxID=1123289 RepID=A0ABZ3IH10_9FIRM|nr:methyl-accepting chemotaxis protein [Sporomusa silvacetica]OZC14806.1 methyl-accepting chemotaxis protein McpA [Sporomusa silvacetica DSM 10669]
MKSIQTKLTVIILLIFIVAMGTLGGLNYWKARQMLSDSLVKEIATLATVSANDVNDWIEGRKLEVAGIALAPVLQTGTPENIGPFLMQAAKNNRRYETFGYIAPTGIALDSTGVSVNLGAREYFQKAMKGEAAVSDPVVSPATGGLVAVVAVPVKLDGKVTGVFFASISLDEISQKTGEVKIGRTGYAYMLKSDGVTIANPNKELVMKDNPIKNDKLPPALRQTAERMVKGEAGTTTYEYNGVEKMVGFAPVKSTGWSLAVSLPVSEATGALSDLTWISLLTILIILAITSIIIIWVARQIAKPITVLEGAANKIAGGDLSLSNLGINSNDEIGRLAKSFEQMTQNVRELIKQIHSNAEQLAASSEELTASAEQSAQASNQVAISMTEVAEGANAQLAAATETSAVVEEMSAGIEEIAANANLVSGQSEQAAGKAKDGGAAVNKAVSQMSQIENTVNTSAQVVAKLGERSKEIGQIVNTISGIAGQTNLLALNAAIEAARAGEQGRGFAVVADEVRKLAEQSEEAAKKIASLIGEIQTDTDIAVEAMNNGTREVKTGAEVVNAAGVSFGEIADLVTEVSDQVKQMSAAIQQMATGSQQIVSSVRNIDDLSKKSAGEAQSVSAATEEQLASMEEISTSSRELATLAQDLQAAVTKFRI